MSNLQRPFLTRLEPIAWFALLALYLWLSYFYILQVPRIGFSIGRNFEITSIANDEFASLNFQVGDKLLQVNDLDLDSDVRNNWPVYRELYESRQEETVPLRLEREGATLSVDLPVHPLGWQRFFAEDFFLVMIKYANWLAGFVLVMFVRPRDLRWRLLIMLFFINSGWVAFGLSGRYGFMVHDLLYQAVVWLSLPVFLHLHWIFPKPLYPLSKRTVLIFYCVCFCIYIYLNTLNIHAAIVGFDFYLYRDRWPLERALRPPIIYMVALLGSLLIILWRYIRFPEQRQQLRLFNLTLFSVLAVLLLWLLGNYVFEVDWSNAGANIFFISQMTLPFVYVYTIYRQQIERLTVRVNTLVSLYAFILLMILVLLIGLLGLQSLLPDLSITTIGLIVGGLAVVAAVYGFEPWRRFFERTVLGIPAIPTQLLAEYAGQVTKSKGEADLVETVQNLVIPTLLIRESMLLKANNERLGEILYAQEAAVPDECPPVAQLLIDQGSHLNGNVAGFEWVRLALPLMINHETIGVWLFGRRDPDNYYDPMVISILQGVADQTAIALTNINQRESLETLYQLNIEQEEAERQMMAHELHDEVLNGLAALMMQVDDEHVSPHFHEMYEKLAKRLRWTIQQLRPPMLNYGLWIALSELAEELESRLSSNQVLLFSVPQSECHVDPQVEQHIYRIVQQGLENAIRHSKAELIRLHGTITPDAIDLKIEDNGIGFNLNGQLDLPELLANRRFGLVGILERSSLIGSELEISSAEDQGTTIHIHWQAAD